MSTVQFKVQRVAPAAQTSTAAYVVLAGSEMNMIDFITLAYTVKVATQSINWKVFGANQSDYSDEVEVQGETLVAAAAAGSYAVSPAPYAYYRVKIVDGAGHGDVTLAGIGKR